MFVGYRKLVLGFSYLVCASALALMAIMRDADLVGAAALLTALGTGVGWVVWGNIREHQAK